MSGSAPDPYATGVTNAQKTITLADAVVNLIAQPVTQIWKKRDVIQALKARLGEWVDEARDAQGRWLQPVLGKEELEDHLTSERGQIQPSGDFKSSFEWAQLLYAINIRPGNGILRWRLPPEQEDPAKTGVTSLVIHGEALCHIINLYQLYTRSVRDQNTYRFPFGKIKLQDEDTHSFTFSYETDPELSCTKQPFQYSLQDERGRREGHLKFDDGVVLAKYFNALDHGASDAAVRLENASKPIQDRVKSLLSGMKYLNERNWDKPYLVTTAWVDEASRIKRRLTTQGGEDTFLVDHVHRYISERPSIVSSLKNSLSKPELWKDELESSVKALCMFQDDSFEFLWKGHGMFQSDKNPRFEAILQQHLCDILEKLSDLNEGSWGRSVSKVVPAPEFLQVLNLQHELVNRAVIVLRLMPADWNFSAEIQGGSKRM